MAVAAASGWLRPQPPPLPHCMSRGGTASQQCQHDLYWQLGSGGSGEGEAAADPLAPSGGGGVVISSTAPAVVVAAGSVAGVGQRKLSTARFEGLRCTTGVEYARGEGWLAPPAASVCA